MDDFLVALSTSGLVPRFVAAEHVIAGVAVLAVLFYILWFLPLDERERQVQLMKSAGDFVPNTESPAQKDSSADNASAMKKVDREVVEKAMSMRAHPDKIRELQAANPRLIVVGKTCGMDSYTAVCVHRVIPVMRLACGDKCALCLLASSGPAKALPAASPYRPWAAAAAIKTRVIDDMERLKLQHPNLFSGEFGHRRDEEHPCSGEEVVDQAFIDRLYTTRSGDCYRDTELATTLLNMKFRPLQFAVVE